VKVSVDPFTVTNKMSSSSNYKDVPLIERTSNLVAMLMGRQSASHFRLLLMLLLAQI